MGLSRSMAYPYTFTVEGFIMKRRVTHINCYFIMDALPAKWTIIRIIGEMGGVDFMIGGRSPTNKS
ncbi:MAG: hypothetical protein ABSG44_17740 [Thermodesulfobacteriota bacterium]